MTYLVMQLLKLNFQILCICLPVAICHPFSNLNNNRSRWHFSKSLNSWEATSLVSSSVLFFRFVIWKWGENDICAKEHYSSIILYLYLHNNNFTTHADSNYTSLVYHVTRSIAAGFLKEKYVFKETDTFQFIVLEWNSYDTEIMTVQGNKNDGS